MQSNWSSKRDWLLFRNKLAGWQEAYIGSAIISAITAKIVATSSVKKADSYVKEMCEMTVKSNQLALAALNKFQKKMDQQESA